MRKDRIKTSDMKFLALSRDFKTQLFDYLVTLFPQKWQTFRIWIGARILKWIMDYELMNLIDEIHSMFDLE